MDDLRSQKLDLAWAGVFLSVVCAVALALLFTFTGGLHLHRIAAIDLILAWLGSVTVVVLLLALPSSRALVMAGRLLVALIFFALVVAAILGSISIAQGY